MVSALDRAKRALVAVIRALVTTYGCNIHVTRDSSDAELTKAYRKLSLKVHPDRGGDEEHQQRFVFMSLAGERTRGPPHHRDERSFGKHKIT